MLERVYTSVWSSHRKHTRAPSSVELVFSGWVCVAEQSVHVL